MVPSTCILDPQTDTSRTALVSSMHWCKNIVFYTPSHFAVASPSHGFHRAQAGCAVDLASVATVILVYWCLGLAFYLPIRVTLLTAIQIICSMAFLVAAGCTMTTMARTAAYQAAARDVAAGMSVNKAAQANGVNRKTLTKKLKELRNRTGPGRHLVMESSKGGAPRYLNVNEMRILSSYVALADLQGFPMAKPVAFIHKLKCHRLGMTPDSPGARPYSRPTPIGSSSSSTVRTTLPLTSLD